MYTSGGEVILGDFLCLDVENMGLDDISWRRLHFLETWLEYGSEADCYLKGTLQGELFLASRFREAN